VFNDPYCVNLKTFHLLFKERSIGVLSSRGATELHWIASCICIKSSKVQLILRCI